MNTKQYQQLFQSLPNGLITLNHAGHITAINRTGAALLGATAEYLHNQELILFLHADSFERYQDNRLLAVDRGEVLSSEIVLRGTDGSTIYTRCDFIPIQAGQLILCLQDISQTKALQSQISALRIPDRTLLHDLNNVFTAIAGYSELTQMMLDERAMISGDELAVMHRYMGEIRIGLDRAEDLIRHARKQLPASEHPGTARASPVKASKRILIVDDEEPIVKYLEELMLQQGYQVDCFTSSKAALEFYRDNADAIDLVILDQTMPELSGLELATEIMSMQLDQPIILCTGTSSLIQDQQSGKINIRYFASKPIDINELLAMVSEILQDPAAQQQLTEF